MARYLYNPRHSSRRLSVPERHQLRIARETLRMSPEMISVAGGPSHQEAEEIVRRLGKRKRQRNPQLLIVENPIGGPYGQKRRHYKIRKRDVGKQADTGPLAPLGRVLEQDVGKWAVEVSPGIWQVESERDDWRFKKRRSNQIPYVGETYLPANAIESIDAFGYAPQGNPGPRMTVRHKTKKRRSPMRKKKSRRKSTRRRARNKPLKKKYGGRYYTYRGFRRKYSKKLGGLKKVNRKWKRLKSAKHGKLTLSVKRKRNPRRKRRNPRRRPKSYKAMVKRYGVKKASKMWRKSGRKGKAKRRKRSNRRRKFRRR